MRPRLMKGTGRVFHVELLHREADGRGLCNAAGCAGHRNGVCARRSSRITAAATAVSSTAACRQAGAEGENQQERACEGLPPPPLRGDAEQQNQRQCRAAC